MSPIEIYLAVGVVFAAYVMFTERGYEVREAAGEILTFALLVIAYPLAIASRIALGFRKKLRESKEAAE